jgi:2-deoxy-D-gluconate 3-dehydrogenase
MSVSFSLEGRRALVTGASRGIGRAIALGLAEAGADVVCASAGGGGADTAERVRALGRGGWGVRADLSDRASIEPLVAEAERLAGPIDILVNNAGTIRRYTAADYPADEWDATIRIDLDAVFLLSQRIGRGMVERGRGKIVNIASLLSFQGGIRVAAYTAAKHGVAGVTRALANEWAGSGVNVNAIAPGYVRTDNTQALQDDVERSGQILARIPAGRWGDPDDIAGAAVFLASPASDYVNGHLLVVDGGWMSR